MIRNIKKYDKNIKERAEKLRKSGASYGTIYNSLKIPKSTLSTWFSDKIPYIVDRNSQLKHLEKIRVLALAANKKKLDFELREIRSIVKKEIETYPLKHIGFKKSILASLYWAEGAKYNRSPVMFANTDPKLSKLFITLLRNCYRVDENKFRIRLHLHYYHNIKKSKYFWSKLLDVPIDKFGKIHIKKRSIKKKFRKNFMGICFIRYYSNRIRKEIMELAYELANQFISIKSP